jgi:hypothetical protein
MLSSMPLHVAVVVSDSSTIGVHAPPKATAIPCKLNAPTVTGISPAIGIPGGGTAVTIVGKHFSNATVYFGSKPGSIVSDTATKIVVRSPAGTGTVAITVKTASGTSVVTSADEFSYSNKVPPVIP